jgi:CelD/BcsL family acetyltransferase involved in cellulose biosynthesis
MNTAVALDRRETVPGVRIEWLRDPARLQLVADQWKQLEQSVELRTHLSSYEFAAAWYRNYAGEYGGTALVGLAWRGSHLVGVAPLAICRGSIGRIPVTRIEFAPTDTPAGEFLIQDSEPEIAGAFIEALIEEAPFDVISLDGFAPDDLQLAAVQKAAAKRRMATEFADHAYAVADLSNGYEQYRSRLSSQFRRKLNQKSRRIADAGGAAIHCVQFSGDDSADLKRGVARVIAITEASYKLKGQRLADRHRGFFAEVTNGLGRHGTLSLPILSIGGQDAAFILGVVERGVFYDVALAHTEAFEKLSPGSFLMQKTLEALAASGVHKVVSHGAHEYKRHWATRFVPQKRIFLFRPGLRSAAIRFIRFSLSALWQRLGRHPESEALT